jgi:hypothetical protein
MTRSQFNSLPPADRMTLVRAGGLEVTDDPPKPRPPFPRNGLLRSEFDKLSDADRRHALKTRTLVDD